MKTFSFCFFLLISLSFCSKLISQSSQIEGMDFENWNKNYYNSAFPTKYYWENLPTNIWASSNAASTIVNDFCCERTTDCKNGSYAARLESKSVYGMIAAGNLFTGKFIANMFNSKALRGVPFTDKPKSISGFYKYAPGTYNSKPDTCSIYSVLSYWDGNNRVEIARAEMCSAEKITEYKNFVIDFQYFSDKTPDTVSVVFTSSKNGEKFEGAAGSTLFIDDVKFDYEVGIDDENTNYNHLVLYTENAWIFSFKTDTKKQISLFDASGKEMFKREIVNNSFKLNNAFFPIGVYFYNITENKHSKSGKLYKR